MSNYHALLKNTTWLDEKEVKTLRSLVGDRAEDFRFVGGCVRDAILGLKVADIDIASRLYPEENKVFFESKGIKTVPTGIAHGTLTVVINRKPFEITSLRRDVQPMGRHAVIEYSQSYEEDAQRRDFTFNALYLSLDGSTLMDPYHGVQDLEQGLVRFIGQAEQRILEDHLRILRYFRFLSRFGRGQVDPEAIQACRQNAGLLASLSRERVAQEFLKLLATPTPVPTLRLMAEALPDFMDKFNNINLLDNFLNAEVMDEVDPYLRLMLILGSSISAIDLKGLLNLSNRQYDRLVHLRQLMDMKADPKAYPSLLLDFGKPALIDYICYLIACKKTEYKDLIQKIMDFNVPVFPVKGSDLMDLGLASGTQIGKILHELRVEWINSNFSMTKQELMGKVIKP